MAPPRLISFIALLATAACFSLWLGACGGGTFTPEPGDEPRDASTRADGGEAADASAAGDAGDCSGAECVPAFRGQAVAIPDEMRQEMIGESWHEDLDCPSLDSLALLRMTHWGMDGAIREGEMVVAESVADDVLEAFGRIYDARFPIERMVPVHNYGGDDDASMEANNTSAFNCRLVTGGSSLSQHSYGTAIDINPVQNPYVRGDTVLPPAGRDYLDRTDVRPGMIVRPGTVTAAFDELGWGWGGDFSSLKDYQHVSESGQ